VKIVVQVKLMPQAAQATALSATLHTVNEAANWVSAVAYECGVPREYELRKHTYAELKARGAGGAGRPARHQEDP
jgi:replicative superfamily II helicase